MMWQRQDCQYGQYDLKQDGISFGTCYQKDQPRLRLPMRWVYSAIPPYWRDGKSKLRTCITERMLYVELAHYRLENGGAYSRPRAETPVAIKIGVLPVRNARKASS